MTNLVVVVVVILAVIALFCFLVILWSKACVVVVVFQEVVPAAAVLFKAVVAVALVVIAIVVAVCTSQTVECQGRCSASRDSQIERRDHCLTGVPMLLDSIAQCCLPKSWRRELALSKFEDRVCPLCRKKASRIARMAHETDCRRKPQAQGAHGM